MRHQNGIKKLNRTGAHRRALLRNLAIALFRHERIETTLVKAKALRPFAEKLITLAKRGDLHARRVAGKHVHDSEILHKLFEELGGLFNTRPGGYTRVLKMGPRKGDNGMMAMIELTERTEKASPKPVKEASAA